MRATYRADNRLVGHCEVARNWARARSCQAMERVGAGGECRQIEDGHGCDRSWDWANRRPFLVRQWASDRCHISHASCKALTTGVKKSGVFFSCLVCCWMDHKSVDKRPGVRGIITAV